MNQPLMEVDGFGWEAESWGIYAGEQPGAFRIHAETRRTRRFDAKETMIASPTVFYPLRELCASA